MRLVDTDFAAEFDVDKIAPAAAAAAALDAVEAGEPEAVVDDLSRGRTSTTARAAWGS